VSDSTNVTKAARREVSATVPTILDLRDCVHHLQNVIKDITQLNTFKPVRDSFFLLLFQLTYKIFI